MMTATMKCIGLLTPLPLIVEWGHVPVILHARLAVVLPINLIVPFVARDDLFAFTASQGPINFPLRRFDWRLRIIVVVWPLVHTSEAHSNSPPFQALRANSPRHVVHFRIRMSRLGSYPKSLDCATPSRATKLSRAATRQIRFISHQPPRGAHYWAASVSSTSLDSAGCSALTLVARGSNTGPLIRNVLLAQA